MKASNMSERPPPDDWRRQGQETYLNGLTLARLKYQVHSPKSDHEHCEFCFAKISEGPDDLHEGYASDDKYRWVCDDCFSDFRDEMDWKVRP